ncbi:MAG: hypothetical protein KCHDKBKB_00888 [Elusimicrobia bacterium]|nr:hypothetical protein [Elusimicrobiota bacterium]
MADPNLNFKQVVSPNVIQRTVLVGRVKMAQALKMPEGEWAKLLSEVEHDPLFHELVNARAEGKRIVKFKRFSRTGLSNQFYESQDMDVVGSSGLSPETLLEQKKHLMALIQKIGQEKFERYFLYREDGDTAEHIAELCGVTLEEAKQVQDFVVDMSVQAEFNHPSKLQTSDLVKPTVIGQIVKNDDNTFSISYYSPHMARGLYDIDRGALRRWQKAQKMDRSAAAKLRKYIGLLELANLKQGAFWRVIDHLLKAQKSYFETNDSSLLAPVSLRKVAAKLEFAPSTLSRVLAAKSVLLPWGREILLLDLMPGQRHVVLNILEKLRDEGKAHMTDMALSHEIEERFHVKVSRRTITACRHVLDHPPHAKAA